VNLVDHKERDTKKVERMFSRISSRYDLLNHMLSLGLDFRWRKEIAREAGRINCQRILDVCTGTGDMAIELSKFWRGKVYIDAIDFSRELIEIGKKKVEKTNFSDKINFGKANAEMLPYQNEQFDAVTVAFGLRNIQDKLKALKEFYRVTRPNGRFICLEFSQPVNPLFGKLYFFYLMKILPYISRLAGSDLEAYRYLGRTIKEFLSPHELVDLIRSAGWENVTYKVMTGGIVAIHKGEKR
jgi:demethylmenaquinone methyltransferase / 2-methoxy-6-polyprenyl-1,4-benzoquinol methylase